AQRPRSDRAAGRAPVRRRRCAGAPFHRALRLATLLACLAGTVRIVGEVSGIAAAALAAAAGATATSAVRTVTTARLIVTRVLAGIGPRMGCVFVALRVLRLRVLRLMLATGVVARHRILLAWGRIDLTAR